MAAWLVVGCSTAALSAGASGSGSATLDRAAVAREAGETRGQAARAAGQVRGKAAYAASRAQGEARKAGSVSAEGSAQGSANGKVGKERRNTESEVPQDN